ncbi:MAG: ribose-phosphate diphosphokinase [Burkholderiales bacterium]|nr:ribose-phosphate diphosphokinase [Burkholderiales bacterium]MDE2453354.1 ribose-phosphate diphosphokinase [Burkholderiales bacterium]
MSLVLAFEDEAALAGALAAALGWPVEIVARHVFPDGETRLTLPPRLPGRVVLLRGLQQPNPKLAELLLAAAGARELGAARLELVCPYLAYMRQDTAFHPGEVVSQRHLGRALAAWFDAVITVDPHLHRVATMDEVVPGRRGIAVSAALAVGTFVAEREPTALLVGPDEEAAQWVQVAAAGHGMGHAVCRKTRRGDRDVEVELPALDWRGRAVVLVDDVASTGRTLASATRALLERGAASVDAVVTHALFVGDAVPQLHAAGLRRLWSSDSVAHPTNAFSVVPLLAGAIGSLK